MQLLIEAGKYTLFYFQVYRRGEVDRLPAFQPGSPGSIPGMTIDFNLYFGTGCMSFVCAVFGGGPNILLTTLFRSPALVILSSVLFHSLAPLTGD